MGLDGKIPVEKFDGSDFGFWKMQIEDYLFGKDLYAPLGVKPKDMEEDAWKLLDRKAMSAVRLSLSRNVAHHTIKATTTQEMLSVLSAMYEKPSAVNKVHLMRRLFNLRMKEDTAVSKHLNEFNMTIAQLQSVEITFEDEVIALILLSSLPESWGGTVTAVSASAGKGKLKFDDVRDLIVSEEIRRRESGSTSGSALNTGSRGRSESRQRSNRGRSKSKGKDKSTKDKSKIKCWNCNEFGHFKNECQSPKDKSVNATMEDHGDALILSLGSQLESWVLDSGASFHSCGDAEIMEHYTSGSFGKVYLADDEALEIIGKGDVRVKTPNGSTLTLHGVRHIPGLKRNLLSVGQLDEEGYEVTFGCSTWKITKGAMVLARGKKEGTLYMTNNVQESIANAEDDGDANLWHCRMGHMSEKGMKVLCSKRLLQGLKTVEIGFCEDCVLGKQKRVSFSRDGRTLKKQKLELVHSDLWGPAPVSSIGGASYYMTFIDDCTRKVWVYFLKHKSDAFECFKRWKARVETETGLKVKCLRSDNGGEYELHEFKEYCAVNGVRMEKTVKGTPQQNGVAERMNRTLNERARSMRLKCGLPKMFWAEAVNTAAFLINRGPSTPLENGIPEEVWSGKKVNLSFVRIFGSTAYVHIADAERSKLDAKSVKCTFVGYGGDDFGYRFWDEQNKKIIRSRDAVFDEKVLYKDRLSTSDSDKSSPDVVDMDISSSGGSRTVQDGQEPIEEESHSDDQEEPSSPEIQLRRSTREHRTPDRFSPSNFYLLLTDNGEPESYAEASHSQEVRKWRVAMDDEMSSLMTNNTWELVELPRGKRALHNKWVYRIKEEADGSKRYKARLVVKGFQQKHGIDYTDVFTPVVKMTTIRLVLSMVAAENLELQQMDVKTAFLHGDLDEDIYMVQPEGYLSKGNEELVCRLKKSLYGLKQAPRQWYKKFDSFMHEIKFVRTEADHCCYFKRFGDGYIILLLYVDDMLIAGTSAQEVSKMKEQLSKRFAMKDLGDAKQILGMRIERDRVAGKLYLSQAEYVRKVLKRFSMENAKPVNVPLGSQFKLSSKDSPKSQEERAQMQKTPYASAIGSLMYAMVCTRPDIAHAVGVVSRFMSNPGRKHWEAVKWVLRYLRSTTDQALCFEGKEIVLAGYVDSDFASSDLEKRRSTTGYVFTLGGTAVSWASKLQKVVALSTTEAEYIGVTEASKEMVWLQNFLRELGKEQGNSILYSDSQSAIHLAKNPAFHSRTKHIEVKYHFIRHLLEKKTLQLEKILGSKNPADMLTKVVTLEKLKLCMASAGLRS
jgi:transposase InsO family protein